MSPPKHKDIATAIGLIGMLSATALVVFGDTHDLDSTWISPIGVIFLAGPSAWVAGLIFGGLFGLSGPWGGRARLGGCFVDLFGRGHRGNIRCSFAWHHDRSVRVI
jgi:hypothetical protein